MREGLFRSYTMRFVHYLRVTRIIFIFSRNLFGNRHSNRGDSKRKKQSNSLKCSNIFFKSILSIRFTRRYNNNNIFRIRTHAFRDFFFLRGGRDFAIPHSFLPLKNSYKTKHNVFYRQRQLLIRYQ